MSATAGMTAMTRQDLIAAVESEGYDIRAMLMRLRSSETPNEVIAITVKFRGASGLVEAYLARLEKSLEIP